MNTQILANIPLFKNLSPDILEHLAATMLIQEVAPGTILFREGQAGHNLYIILYGQLDIIKAWGTPDERLIACRNAGEFIGELGLVNEDRLRTATVRSRGPAQVWKMSYEDFDALLPNQPGMAYALVKTLSSRLTAAHEITIQDLHEKNQQLQTAYDELKAAHLQIIEKERMEKELDVAYEIQMSLLPQTLPQIPGFDFGAHIVPARRVGGDFYDIFPLDADTVGIVIGDVADKGVPSAIFMAQTHALLYASATSTASPADVLRQTNHHLLHMNASSLFATVLYGVLHRATGEFTYARAGHELPLIRHPTGEITPAAWNPGQPLGMLEDPRFDEQTLCLEPGASLLLYTDGLTDGRCLHDDCFGPTRVTELFQAAGNQPAQQICDHLWQALFTFQGQADQDDDVTLVVIRALENQETENDP